MIEREVERYLVRRVRELGGRADKVEMIGQRGFFDRLVLLPGGTVVFAETKRPRGSRTSPQQQSLHAAYRDLGQHVVVLKSCEDVDRLLDGIVR